MSRIEKLYRGTLSAWGMLIDFPLPEYFRRQLGRGADSLSTACGFPLVGVAVGILLAIAALSRLLPASVLPPAGKP